MTDFLPRPLRPAARETLPSYLARLASSRGVNSSTYSLDLGTTLRRLFNHDQGSLAELAHWAQLSEEDLKNLLSWTGERIGDLRLRFRGEVFGSRALRNPVIRGCPVCIREDLQSHGGPAPAMPALQGHWQHRETAICLKHRHLLVPLWAATPPEERYNTVERISEIREAILRGDYDQPPIDPTAYDRWLDHRLETSEDTAGLEHFTVYAVTTFARLLGVTLLRESDQELKNSPYLHHQALAAGFNVIAGGDPAIIAALDTIAARADEQADEPLKTFDALYRRLGNDRAGNPDFAHFHKLLRDCILRNWQYPAGAEVFGQRLERRLLHSLRSVWDELRVNMSIADHFLTEAGAFAHDDNRPPSRKLFDAERYQPLLLDIAKLVGPQKMQQELGMKRSDFNSLVAAGLLVPATSTRKLNEPWRLCEGKALLASLTAKVSLELSEEKGWEAINQSTRRTWAPLADLIKAILSGRLTLARQGPLTGYSALRLNRAEVGAWFSTHHNPARDLPGVMSAAAFGRSVGLRDKAHFQKLMEDGHVQGVSTRHPRTGQMQWRVDNQHISAFHQRFVTVTTLRRELNISHPEAMMLLRRSGALPFEAAGQSYGALWLRTDIKLPEKL